MSTVITGRSPIAIAEDNLLEAANKVFNVSRAEAVRFCTQRRELGRETRIQAEQLLDEWEGSVEQMRQANMLVTTKRFAIAHQL